MADKPIPVQVEVTRMDSFLFPLNFPAPLVDSLVGQSVDIVNVADKGNEAANSAYEANVKNEEQDATLIDHDHRITTNKDKNDTQDITLTDHEQRITDNKSTNDTQDFNIQSNTDAIGTTNSNLKNHTSSNSQHGVIGNNVGTEDYCSLTAGGVVLLATEVAELTYTPITIANAPATYDQAYAQAQTDAIKSVSTQLSALYDKVNEIIQVQITAKQMDSSQP